VQGEREMAGDCRSLGVFVLRIPPMPAGMPRVEVEFLVDANGVLTISAIERRSGRTAGLQVIPNHGLTDEEVHRMEAESLAHAAEDLARHRIVDLAANSKLDAKWIREQLERFGPALDLMTASDLTMKLQTVEDCVARAERDWRSVDAGWFASAKDQLDRASLRLQELAIAESLRSQG
jgi:molecular chaperone DnaK (HSP70)